MHRQNGPQIRPTAPAVQGTVKRTAGSVVKVDDGTGLLDLLVTSSAASAPGSDAASVGPGAYVLAQGRLQARPAPGGAALEYSVKVHKVCAVCAGAAAALAAGCCAWRAGGRPRTPQASPVPAAASHLTAHPPAAHCLPTRPHASC